MAGHRVKRDVEEGLQGPRVLMVVDESQMLLGTEVKLGLVVQEDRHQRQHNQRQNSAHNSALFVRCVLNKDFRIGHMIKRVRPKNLLDLQQIPDPVILPQQSSLQISSTFTTPNLQQFSVDVKHPPQGSKLLLGKNQQQAEITVGRRRARQVKNTCRFDYNPELCKDFHDAGYCVFGNSCLYIHDRSQYKTGWQLQKQWQEGQKQKWMKQANPDFMDEHQLKELQKFKPRTLQVTCPICKGELRQPLLTSCKHLGCQQCLLPFFKSNKQCPTCKSLLKGNFRNGSLFQQQERAERKREQESYTRKVEQIKRRRLSGPKKQSVDCDLIKFHQ